MDLTSAARDGQLRIPIAAPLALAEAASAHDRVDAGNRQRIVLDVDG